MSKNIITLFMLLMSFGAFSSVSQASDALPQHERDALKKEKDKQKESLERAKRLNTEYYDEMRKRYPEQYQGEQKEEAKGEEEKDAANS